VKRSISKWIGALFAVTGMFSWAPVDAAVPLARNLQAAGQRAISDCKPLLLEFSAVACDYCRLLEVEILNPTLLNSDYDHRVLMQKLLIDQSDRLTGFDGETVTAEELAAKYRVYVTPTLLFVDAEGRELADRMVGVTTLDFYGGYLDIALDNAQRKLRSRGDCD
jgi:thioredoxin-related protein